MARIVIIGGSFGGLTVALKLKQMLKGRHRITVISDCDRFVFMPSLPWLALGWRKAPDISFGLKGYLPSKGIYYIHDTVIYIDPGKQKLSTTREEFPYDYLVLATGPHFDFDAVPGLGPEKGYTESIFTLEHAEKAFYSWQKYLGEGGPVVVGATQGVSCFGPSYECILEIDHQLRKLGRRSKTPLYFVTSEPYLGHFGLGGVGKSRRLMEDEFAEKDIKVFCNAVVEEILPDRVRLRDGTELPFKFAMFAPPFRGVDAIIDSGLGNAKGWLMVDDYYRLPGYGNIYAAGVAVGIMPAEPMPVPTGVPKTGNMTIQMARIVAHNIAADIQGGPKISLPVTEIGVTCFADMGSTAALMAARPALPPRQRVILTKKRWVRWAKLAFERYFMVKMKLGAMYLPV